MVKLPHCTGQNLSTMSYHNKCYKMDMGVVACLKMKFMGKHVNSKLVEMRNLMIRYLVYNFDWTIDNH